LPLQDPFESRLQVVEGRIEAALKRSGRKRQDVKVVAVSKKFSAAAIMEAYRAGLRDFGENYVQEFTQKRSQLNEASDARFHLIGHLQSNKARVASELFDCIQTVDSAKLVERLESDAAALGKRLEVMFEVKLSDEESKSGASADDLRALLDASAKCGHLAVTGLMTMPPWSEDPEHSRPYFRELAALARRYGLSNLSMGMSGDLEVAIEEGSTLIRVGTALFGPRPKPNRSETTSPVI
jgi:pyridoxal phosphate enzyme (YggS family)